MILKKEKRKLKKKPRRVILLLYIIITYLLTGTVNAILRNYFGEKSIQLEGYFKQKKIYVRR
jgi:hypothetical protein